MTHQFVDSYPDYAAVLHRTDEQPAKDERFIARAFLTCGFEDQTSGDDLEFRHIESGAVVTCDGDAVAIHLSDDEAQLRVSYSDLFLVLRNLEWETASLYCTGDIEDKLHEFASFIPASYDFELSPGVSDTEEEVDGLRQAIAGHAAAPDDEPSVRISDLSPSNAEPPVGGTSGSGTIAGAASPVATKGTGGVSAVMPELPAAMPAPQRSEVARQAATPIAALAPHHGPQTDGGALVDFLLRANEDYRTQVSDLIALVRQLTGKDPQMNRFAAAVLPLDSLAIAHVSNRKAAKLADLGLVQDYNVMVHEEYGVVVDGAFVVFSKDAAPPEWTQMLIGRLGGVISRLWQSDASVVGTVLEQFVPATSAESDSPDSKVPVEGSDTGAVNSSAMTGTSELAASDSVPAASEQVRASGKLTADQQQILDGFMSPLRFALEQVFTVKNEGAALERRVAEIEAGGLTVLPGDGNQARGLNGSHHNGRAS